MGDDREARILGAAETIGVGDKEYKLRPVTARHLCDLQRESLRHYKRQYLETIKDASDLLGNGQERLERAIGEAARWTLKDLPQMDAFDVSRVPLTDKLVKWLENAFGDLPEKEDGKRALVANALDNGTLEPAELKKLAGKSPLRGKVRYDQWWVTAMVEGMVAFIASSLKGDHPEITSQTVAGWPFDKIAEASRIVESITSADMGNT